MKAAVLENLPATSLGLSDVAEPQLDSNDVLVSVIACGICGTDLHIMDGESYRPELPFVLGHEPVGNVVSVGPNVDKGWLGKRIVPILFEGCGICTPCRAGDERLCVRGARVTGVSGKWGGFAEYLVLDAHQLVYVPQSVSSITAAGLVDAGATAYNAVRSAIATNAFVGYGSGNHLVMGAGPVGMLVAEFLAHAGKEFIMVESNSFRAEAAGQRGFRVYGAISQLSGKFSSVIDCAGSADLIPQLLDLLEPHGIFTCVGYTKLHDFDLSVIARNELLVRGVRSGSRSDLEEVLNLVASGEVSPPSCETWELSDINRALSALRNGTVGGKAVIVMGSSDAKSHK